MCLRKPVVSTLFRKWEYKKENLLSDHLFEGPKISHRPSIHLDKREYADKKSSRESLLITEVIFSF